MYENKVYIRLLAGYNACWCQGPTGVRDYLDIKIETPYQKVHTRHEECRRPPHLSDSLLAKYREFCTIDEKDLPEISKCFCSEPDFLDYYKNSIYLCDFVEPLKWETFNELRREAANLRKKSHLSSKEETRAGQIEWLINEVSEMINIT